VRLNNRARQVAKLVSDQTLRACAEAKSRPVCKVCVTRLTAGVHRLAWKAADEPRKFALAFAHRNRCGDIYWLQSAKPRTGEPRYFL
jgi:hypothetical protein